MRNKSALTGPLTLMFVIVAFGLWNKSLEPKPLTITNSLRNLQGLAYASNKDDSGAKAPTVGKGTGSLLVVAPSPSPVYTSEQEQIVAYIKAVFQNDSSDALKIAQCESHMNPNAVGHNSNGSTDYSIFQINSIHQINPAYLMDWHINVDVAYKMFKEQGWTPWVCYTKYHATER